MTQVEKQYNKADLRNYKNKAEGLQGMIPGLNNISSVGSGPTLRKAYNNKSMSNLADAKSRYSTDIGSMTNREIQ